MNHSRKCPVCGENGDQGTASPPRVNGGYIRCLNCGLEYVADAIGSTQSYNDAYRGLPGDLADHGGYGDHVSHGEYLARLPSVGPFLTNAERHVMKWVKHQIPKRSAILDVGCGIGRFMMCLRQEGYAPYGADVAEKPVEMLKQHGFHVAKGLLDDVPYDWPQPKLITCFEVLEHVHDPVPFLSRIRERFPHAQLVVVVPCSESRVKFDRKFREADVPPNHLTHWTRDALKLALQKAGYGVKISPIHASSAEIAINRPGLRRAENFLYRVALRVERCGRALGVWPSSQIQGGKINALDVAEWYEARTRRLLRQVLNSPWKFYQWGRKGSCYWFLATATPIGGDS
jgi:SAM-dependent methyltransferase